MNNPVFRCSLSNPKITANLKVNAFVSRSDIGNGKLSLYDINGNLLGEFSANQFNDTDVIVSGGGGGIPNVDGGNAYSVYTTDQIIDGGNAGNNVGDI